MHSFKPSFSGGEALATRFTGLAHCTASAPGPPEPQGAPHHQTQTCCPCVHQPWRQGGHQSLSEDSQRQSLHPRGSGLAVYGRAVLSFPARAEHWVRSCLRPHRGSWGAPSPVAPVPAAGCARRTHTRHT